MSDLSIVIANLTALTNNSNYVRTTLDTAVLAVNSVDPQLTPLTSIETANRLNKTNSGNITVSIFVNVTDGNAAVSGNCLLVLTYTATIANGTLTLTVLDVNKNTSTTIYSALVASIDYVGMKVNIQTDLVTKLKAITS